MHSLHGASPKKGTASGCTSSLLRANANELKGENSKAPLVSRLAVRIKTKIGRESLYKMVFFLFLVGVSVYWLKDWLPEVKTKGNSSHSNPSLHEKDKKLTNITKSNHNHEEEHQSEGMHPGSESQHLKRDNGVDPAATRASDGQDVVVVVGGGLAGCSAVIEAAKRGARVLLLEKEAKLGGNSAKATSGINGWGTPAQAKAGVQDGGRYFERDTYRSGRDGNCQAGLVGMLSVKSADAVRWLTEFGVQLSVLSQLGGHSRRRTHRAPDRADGTPVPVGFAIMQGLEAHLRGKLGDSVEIQTNARLSHILHESVELTGGERATVVGGVVYKQLAADGAEETVQVAANAVVLTTGGFSNDRTANSLLQEHAPGLMNYPTTNGVWSTGDGVKAARELGAALVDMDKVQLHPTGMINPKHPEAKTLFLGPEALRGSGGILLNKKGERFVNELGLRSVVSQAIIAQGDEFPNSQGRKFTYCVLNEAAAELFGKGALGFYWKKMGLFQFVENVSELARFIGCEESTLRQTLQNYNDLSLSGEKCPLTGKDVFPCVVGTQGPFYVTHVTPSIHYTMGGCLISPSAEVLAVDGADPFRRPRPILGLFGAGEVTGGVHGGNRLGGNSLLECVVFGRIAGERAAQAALEALPDRAPGSFRGNAAMKPGGWVRGVVQQLLPDDPTPGELGSPPGQGQRLVIALPGPFQASGLALLQPMRLRAPAPLGAGETTPLRVVPTTPPGELGAVSIALPPRTAGGAAWGYALKPADVVEMQAGPLTAPASALNKRLREINEGDRTNLVILATAPEGANPMLQLIRASLQLPLRKKLASTRLLYAANSLTEMSHRSLLKDLCSGGVECLFALENPPPKWTEEVEMDESTIKKILPAAADPSSSIIVVLTQKAEKISLIKHFFEARQFKEGVSLFIITS